MREPLSSDEIELGVKSHNAAFNFSAPILSDRVSCDAGIKTGW